MVAGRRHGSRRHGWGVGGDGYPRPCPSKPEPSMLHRQEPCAHLGRRPSPGRPTSSTGRSAIPAYKLRSWVVIHGKKSSKFNWDCAICRSCRWTVSSSAAPKWWEYCIKWREIRATAPPGQPRVWSVRPSIVGREISSARAWAVAAQLPQSDRTSNRVPHQRDEAASTAHRRSS